MNPAVKALGYGPDDRLVILHADDLGMCGATISAYTDLIHFGILRSTAVMTPCPWFQAAVRACQELGPVDVGVHITLTSEWDSYRWGPLSTRDAASGLLDEEGYLHRTTAAVQASVSADAVRSEMRAQMEHALSAGLDVTHIDTHMGAVVHPKFIPVYAEIALEYRLPLMFLRGDETRLRAFFGLDAAAMSAAVTAQVELEQGGIPLLDHHYSMPLGEPLVDRVAHVKAALNALPPGISNFVIHPAADTPELRTIAPDWRARVADYESFLSDELRAFIADAPDIHAIEYRALRDLISA